MVQLVLIGDSAKKATFPATGDIDSIENMEAASDISDTPRTREPGTCRTLLFIRCWETNGEGAERAASVFDELAKMWYVYDGELPKQIRLISADRVISNITGGLAVVSLPVYGTACPRDDRSPQLWCIFHLGVSWAGRPIACLFVPYRKGSGFAS